MMKTEFFPTIDITFIRNLKNTEESTKKIYSYNLTAQGCRSQHFSPFPLDLEFLIRKINQRSRCLHFHGLSSRVCVVSVCVSG